MSDLGGDGQMESAADAIIADLEALRRAPLAEPYAGPAILEGKAAGVFFHEIFGHRVEGHRQKNEEEGQTFAKQSDSRTTVAAFISVFDDSDAVAPRRRGPERLLTASTTRGSRSRRAPLVDVPVSCGGSCFALLSPPAASSTPTRRWPRQGAGVVSRRGNLVVERAWPLAGGAAPPVARRGARAGGAYGLFSAISGWLSPTPRAGVGALQGVPRLDLVYPRVGDGPPAPSWCAGSTWWATPLSALSKIIAASTTTRPSTGTAAPSRGSCRSRPPAQACWCSKSRSSAATRGTKSRRCSRRGRWRLPAQRGQAVTARALALIALAAVLPPALAWPRPSRPLSRRLRPRPNR